MTNTLKQYLIADFDKISNEGIVYTLDASVLSIIQQLNNQVSSPDYGNASRVDEKRLHETFHVKRHGGRTHHDKEFDIKICTNQHLIKKDTDLRADTIRKLLNKITTKTYNDLFPTLILEFDKILELQDDDKRIISMLVLSIVSETSARPSGARPLVPAKMTSSIFPPRRDFAPCSPITQVRASTTLDFPEPFGPTTQVIPGSRRRVVVEAKDLKPLSVMLFKYTWANLSVYALNFS